MFDAEVCEKCVKSVRKVCELTSWVCLLSSVVWRLLRAVLAAGSSRFRTPAREAGHPFLSGNVSPVSSLQHTHSHTFQ